MTVITLDSVGEFQSIALRDLRVTGSYIVELALPMDGPDEPLVGLAIEPLTDDGDVP
jgi:hypothetical protein